MTTPIDHAYEDALRVRGLAEALKTIIDEACADRQPHGEAMIALATTVLEKADHLAGDLSTLAARLTDQERKTAHA